jgi:hypothetical protein
MGDEMGDSKGGGVQPEGGEEDGAIALILELIGDGEGDFGVLGLVVREWESIGSKAMGGCIWKGVSAR